MVSPYLMKVLDFYPRMVVLEEEAQVLRPHWEKGSHVTIGIFQSTEEFDANI